MAKLPKPGAGGDFKPCPEGQFPAICYQIIHLGTQDVTFQGEKKHTEQVRFAWELHDDETKLEDGRPMMIGQDYTWSMSEKANLRKMLESWEATSFDDEDFGEDGLEIQSFLGKPCMITVVHNKGKNDKVYANVKAVTKLHKSIKIQREPENDPVYLWLSREEFDHEIFDKLPDWLKDKISESPEYQALGGSPTKSSKPSGGKARNKRDDDSDEIPF